MKIIIDAMGGDNAPEEIVIGAINASKEMTDEILLVGNSVEIDEVISKNGGKPQNITVCHAEDKITMHDNPATALREKPQSSLSVALKMLKTGEGDALISAGNTGALLSGATLVAKRISGIRRATIVAQLPSASGKVLLVDAGANVDCTPEYLLQFAIMGSFYMQGVGKIQKPRVGLLNNGTEEGKGTDLQIEAFALLKEAHENGVINFVGNVEGSGVFKGECDVIVCDGFTGNILLKTAEGVGSFIGKYLKDMFLSSLKRKIGALLVKSGIDGFRAMMDYRETGAAPLLGISKPVLKAHGSSDRIAIRNAIVQAKLYTESGMIAKIEENIGYMTAPTQK